MSIHKPSPDFDMLRSLPDTASAEFGRLAAMPQIQRLTLVVMCLVPFAWLCGCSDGGSGAAPPSGRYVSPQSFEQNLTRQTALSPKTLEQLRQLGVNADSALKLEYFFYTDAKAKAEPLAQKLRTLNYSVESRPLAGDQKLYLITGWTTPMRMDEETVTSWTEYMVRLGYEHDAEFDGWGTTPGQ